MPAHELRRGIGYVIQHAGLFPHRTIVDNIATVPLPARHGQEARPGRARWSCSSGSGSTRAFAKRYPAQLSGGQQQRVGVARALAADPPVMLMDEPFSAVDPVVREQLQDEFLRLQGELGKTIVFVTHDIDEAIKLGDQVAVLRVGGTLAQLAAPAELLVRPGRRLRRRLRRARPRLPGARASAERRHLPDAASEPTVAHRASRCRTGGDGRGVLVVDDDAAAPGLARPRRRARARRGRRGPDALPRRHPRHPGRHAARGPRRLPVLAVGPRRGRRRRRAGCVGTMHARREVLDLIEAPGERCRPGDALPIPLDSAELVAAGTSSATSSTTAARSSAGCGTTPGSRSCPVVVGLLLALPLGWLARRYQLGLPADDVAHRAALHDPLDRAVRAGPAAARPRIRSARCRCRSR